ncbi:uncharacterized protein MJAP1_004059 [Malassezia japonica]|uniref:Saccharopine dehydrogenase NADP binding domain-containing protein n=1 Tax=Malassezia japonica TaxID=223818 RepID=A0AAF0F7D7_9BASI|nr:uncharacterized protein MJAP1_004059 [Malassezia japonica]WFD41066.1 hypothetical protein MJAP1_004059 [Malassezia japonica]
MSPATPFDVVLYGATGFTGSLTAQYLAVHPQAPKVAFAGRNLEKLRNVRDKLTNVSKERLESIELIEASASDYASLQRLAASAKVVINMVGPYGQLGGFEVAKAAAEAGKGYVDLTGESDVFEHIAKDLHAVAKQTKAVLVPSSGFDSMPFDLSTYFAVQEVKKIMGPAADVDHVVCGYLVKGTMSGGTLASAVSMRDHPDALKYNKPYLFSPVQGSLVPKVAFSRWLPQFNKYGSFSLFTPHNTRVVSRTWGLLEEARLPVRYGSTFRYLEGFVAPSKFAAIAASTIFQILAWLIFQFAFVGNFLKKLVPQGTGGSMEKQLQGFANVRTVAYGRDGKTQGLSVFRVKGDPGYLKTAAFISETALTLALEKERLSPLAQQGGVLTTASIGAEALADRLGKYAGVTIESANITGSADPSAVLKQ